MQETHSRYGADWTAFRLVIPAGTELDTSAEFVGIRVVTGEPPQWWTSVVQPVHLGGCI